MTSPRPLQVRVAHKTRCGELTGLAKVRKLEAKFTSKVGAFQGEARSPPEDGFPYFFRTEKKKVSIR